MNPALPRDRLLSIAKFGGVDQIAFDASTADLAGSLGQVTLDICDEIAQLATDNGVIQHVEVKPTEIAYQMFTSGSTGDPKGVPVSYGSLSHYVTGIIDCLQMPEGGRYSQLFDLSFDLSIHDIFVTLANGGTIVSATAFDLLMPHVYIEKMQLDHWFSVPVLAASAARGQAGKELKWQLSTALFCGEALPTDYASNFCQFIKDGGPLFNLYGPTEATIAFTTRKFDPDLNGFPTVPLGNPFGGNVIAIETENGIIPSIDEGGSGELLLGGPQIFAGYDPDLGDGMFISDDGQKYYRSGDLVEVVDGELIHLGRKDSQIKLHGYRIELGEIEAVFRRQFGCSAAAAIVIGEAEQGRIVVAFEHDGKIDDIEPLRDNLPAYMIPSAIKRLDALPTNVNGKVDRKALASLDWTT